MILFSSDYQKYSKVHIHAETKNLSFIKMWKILKDMGIKNNKFFLTLLQPELKDIDVHNLKDPSLELRMKIIYEIRANPWYYFREVIRIPASGGSIPFRLHRANLALIWLFLNYIDIIMVSPRQMGKTVGSGSLCSYPLFFRNMNTTMAMLTKDNKTRVENVKKLIDIRNGLPDYLLIKGKRDKNNTEEVYYEALNNRYDSYINQKDPLRAEALGRGLTSAIQHWDEFAFFKYNYISFPAALSAMNDAVDKAKEKNQLYGLIITTTAGQLDVKEGEYVYKDFITKSMMFNETFYDFENRDELKKIVDTNSKNAMVLLEYNPLQLGKTAEWIKEKIKKIKSEGVETIKRDYFNIWTYSRKSKTLPPEVIEKLKMNEKEPLYTQKIDKYVIYWYVDKNMVHSNLFKSIPIAVGLDGSENVGRDYTTLVFLDGRDLNVLGVLRCNESNITQFGHFVANILIQYPNMILIPERNSTGVAIIDTILLDFQKERINPFLRIYNKFVEEEIKDIHDFKSRYFDIDDIPRSKVKTIGFRTHGNSRDLLYKYTFKRAIEHNYNKIHDKMLINEIIKLRIKNNRIDHEANEHDDLVIAYLLTLFFFYYSTKLDIYYSNKIIKFDPLCNYSESDKNKENDDNVSIEDFSDILIEIKETTEKLKYAKTDLQKSQLLHYLRFLKSLVPEDQQMYVEKVISMKDVKELNIKRKKQNNENNKDNEIIIPSSYSMYENDLKNTNYKFNPSNFQLII